MLTDGGVAFAADADFLGSLLHPDPEGIVVHLRPLDVDVGAEVELIATWAVLGVVGLHLDDGAEVAVVVLHLVFLVACRQVFLGQCKVGYAEGQPALGTRRQGKQEDKSQKQKSFLSYHYYIELVKNVESRGQR